MSFRLERAFPVLALVAGLAYLLLLPPLLSTDEVRHFYRAMQVATGGLVPEEQEHLLGGTIPVSCVEFSERCIPWDPKTDLAKLSSLRVGDEQRFVEFHNIAIYPPIAYLPSAAAIRIVWLFDDSLLHLMYAGRLGNLVAWILLVTLSLRLVLRARWAIAAVALLPLNIQHAVSLSADPVQSGLVILFLALVLRSLDAPPFLSYRQLAAASTCLFLGVLSKLAYLPIALLLLVPPPSAFSSRRTRWRWILCSAGATVLGLATWLVLLRYIQGQPAPGAGSPVAQMRWILSHPRSYVGVLWTTFLRQADLYVHTGLGSLGALRILLPYEFAAAHLVVLLLASLPLEEDRPPLEPVTRGVLLLTFLATWIFLWTVMYLTVNTVGAPWIRGFLGRYLLPVLPVLLASLQVRVAPRCTRWSKRFGSAYVCLMLLISSGYLYQDFWAP